MSLPDEHNATESADSVTCAARAIQPLCGEQPRLGIVLGSGLGEVIDVLTQRVELPYDAIPGFPRTTAKGHAGRVWLGRLNGVPTLVQQGRFHRYEGHSTDMLMLPVRVMHRLGVTTLVITNASGGLDPNFRPGDVMVIRDHVNMQNLARRTRGEFGLYGSARPIYDQLLLEQAQAAARQVGIELRQGVYVGVTGPNYETRAEYRMFRRIGGDVVGMSTIAEAVAAAELGMSVLGLSLIANVALPDAPEKVAHEQVLRAVAGAADDVRRLLLRLAETAFGPLAAVR